MAFTSTYISPVPAYNKSGKGTTTSNVWQFLYTDEATDTDDYYITPAIDTWNGGNSPPPDRTFISIRRTDNNGTKPKFYTVAGSDIDGTVEAGDAYNNDIHVSQVPWSFGPMSINAADVQLNEVATIMPWGHSRYLFPAVGGSPSEIFNLTITVTSYYR